MRNNSLVNCLILILFVSFNSLALAADYNIKVDFVLTNNLQFQKIDGFGAGFRLHKRNYFFHLPEAAQNEILDKLFDPDELGVNIILLTANRALCPDPEHCGPFLPSAPEDIRFVKKARLRNPDIKVCASTFAPPEWMVDYKEDDNGHYQVLCRTYCDNCEDNGIYDCIDEHAYWLYTYLQYYEEEEVPIQYFSLQNEPEFKMYFEEPTYNQQTCYCDYIEYEERLDKFLTNFNSLNKVRKPVILLAENESSCGHLYDYGGVVTQDQERWDDAAYIIAIHNYLGYYFGWLERECEGNEDNNFCCGINVLDLEDEDCDTTNKGRCLFCHPLGDYSAEAFAQLDEECERGNDEQNITGTIFNESRCKVACERQIGYWGSQNELFPVWMTEICNLPNRIYGELGGGDDTCYGCPSLIATEENPIAGELYFEFQEALRLAQQIHFTMVCEKSKAFLFLEHSQCWAKDSWHTEDYYGMGFYATYLSGNGQTTDYRLVPHNYYAMRHFSYFINEGSQRVQVLYGQYLSENINFCNPFVEDENYPPILVSAYKKLDANNYFERAVIVIINYGDADKWLRIRLVNLPNVNAKTFVFYKSFYRSSVSNIYWDHGYYTNPSGGELYFSIPAYSIYTLYWERPPQ